MNSNWEYKPFNQVFDWCDKSKIKSGEGRQVGKYKMFVCSDSEIKRYDDYLEDKESLIFGTGGKASCHYVNEKFAYSTDCIVAQRKIDNILTKFYYYYFRQRNMAELQSTFTGSGLEHTSRKKVGAIIVPVPPLLEQERIVARIEELLAELDKSVAALKRAKEQVEEYKEAVIQSTFEFTDTKEKIIAYTLGDIVKPEDGLRRGPFGSAIKKSFFVESGYKVYEQGNAINDDPYRGNYFIDKNKYDELVQFHVQPQDLLVSCSGVTLGRIVELPSDAKPGVINQALLRIRLDKNLILNKYFVEYFRSTFFQRKIFERSQGTGMPNLVGIKKFKQIEIKLPSIEIQYKIVDKMKRFNSVCSQNLKFIDDMFVKADLLRQSILKKAFEG